MSDLFITTMYRWGDREGHSYLVGVFDNEMAALKAGRREELNRSGKYDAAITKVALNGDVSDYDTPPNWITVKGLPDQRPIIMRNYKSFEVVSQLVRLADDYNGPLKRPAPALKHFCESFLAIMEDVR